MKGFGKNQESEKNSSSNELNKVTNIKKNRLLNEALKFHSQANIEEAISSYESFLNCGYTDPRVFSNYGVICQQKGDITKAIFLYKQSIKLYPNDFSSFLNLGTILKQLGKLEESSQLFKKAIELNPKSDKAYLNLGSVLNDLKRFNDAEYFTRKAIKLNTNYSNAYYNLSSILHSLGRLSEAEISIKKAISLKPNHANAYYNLGSILNDQNKYGDAEICLRKAIQINPQNVDYYYNLANTLRKKLDINQAKMLFLKVIELNHNYFNAYNNLSEILKSQGKFEEAEKYLLKAIEINPCNAKSYFILSSLPYSSNLSKWKSQLFSDNLLKTSEEQSKIDIFFARSNILHKEKKYDLSSQYLKLANDSKLNLYKSDADHLLKVSQDFLLKSCSFDPCIKQSINENIFIVGMPRSGSTLLESILSRNPLVFPLGETNIFEESLISANIKSNSNSNLDLNNIYTKTVKLISNNSKIVTNKWLYNYMYSGFILNLIPNARIIHCVRNPLDNILSIYRSHFAHGNRYASSLIDCSKVYLDQNRVMNQYKLQFSSLIYELNYDLLVTNPEFEIKSLITWLNWHWNDSYLKPNLNTRFVSTASSVQVRSEINSHSVEGWRNYQNILKPAIEIITGSNEYKGIC